MNGLISGIGILYAVSIPNEVTIAASNKDIPVPIAALLIAFIPPPSSLIRLEICMEKSTPTPTRIEPIMTVTNETWRHGIILPL